MIIILANNYVPLHVNIIIISANTNARNGFIYITTPFHVCDSIKLNDFVQKNRRLISSISQQNPRRKMVQNFLNVVRRCFQLVVSDS